MIKFYQKYLSPFKENMLSVYTNLFKLRIRSNSKIWGFQRKYISNMENITM